MSSGRLFTVQLRRHRPVKPEAEAIDGRTFRFRYGWEIEDDSTRYPGETAWVPSDDAYPLAAPSWIASGDLKEAQN